MKRIIVFIITIAIMMNSFSLVLSYGSSLEASGMEEEKIISSFGKGYIEDDIEDVEALSCDGTTTYSTVALPSGVDLSSSKYFPYVIGNQSVYNSCGSFAVVYYQYTYEVNKMLDISCDSNADIYSPRYIYNYLNFGSGNNGTTIRHNYEALETFGSLTLSEFPYISNGAEGFKEWSTDVEAMRNALSIRVTDTYSHMLDGSTDSCVITSNKDADLNAIKNELVNGKILVTGSDFEWNSKAGYGDDSNKIIAYRCIEQSDAHAFAIVGYDDNVECDVNGNGKIEACEKGAFKLVNSWGTSFNQDGISSSDGFFWILYDALNGVSANNYNNWESKLSGTRCTAFVNSNAVFAMEVDEKEVNFVGQLKINTPQKYKFSLRANDVSYDILQIGNRNSTEVSYDGTIVFDYNRSPISYILGYDWRVAYHESDESSKAYFSLTDDLGNTIKYFGLLDGSTGGFTSEHVAINMGDVNYDGSINSTDAQLVLKYASKAILFSKAQKYIGDMNADGVVNAIDASLILK